MPENIYTISEVAKLLKTNKNYIYQIIKEGKLKTVKIGTLKVRESDLQKFINELN